MKSNTVIIEEQGQLKESSKNMILNVIDNQINSYKLSYLSKWERDHSTSTRETNAKIKSLEAKKKQIERMFESLNSEEEMVDLMFSISVQSTVKSTQKEMAYSAS